MDKIKTNTILGMDLFRDEFENSLIFHIPHSQTEIPKQFKSDFVNPEIVENEIELLTDFGTDQIFNIEGRTKIVFPYSRVFCDVERLDDDNEVMFKYGRGFFYTKTDDGKVLRKESKNKTAVFEDYYLKHHESLTNTVDQKLNDSGFPILIDCHSFPDVPFVSDIEQDPERPDFCLGTDDFHTPQWLTDMVYLHLKNLGYTVELNYPYNGTIVPMKHYKKNSDVHSIMIEVNRKLYMRDGGVLEDKIKELNKIFSNLF